MRLAASISLALVAASVTPQYDPFAEAKRAVVNGTELAYVARGAGGVPVVLVHGSGADLRTWGYQLQFFGRSRHTVVYSRRFHHPNAPPDAEAIYSAAQHAEDLIALARQIAGPEVDLVASSYGAVVALMAAANQPTLVRRLVLVEPAAFSLLPAGSPDASALTSLGTARRQLLEGQPEPALRTFLSTLIAPGAFDLLPETTRAMLRDNLPELTAEARSPMVTIEPPFGCDDVGRVKVPTLLVDGGSSAAFLKTMTRRVAECLPRAETRTIAGAAHAVHAQQVEAFNALAQEFLGRN